MQNKYIWQIPDWSQFKWQDRELLKILGKARAAQSQLLTRVKSLRLEEQDWAHQELLLEEALQTASIEGEKYKRNSIRSSIAKHLGLPGGRTQKTEPRVDGLVQVLLDATQKYNEPLTKNRLKSWHASLFPTGYSGLHKIEVGEWRSEPVMVVSGAIGKEKIHYEGLPAKLVDEEMNSFLSWWKDSSQLDGLLRAAIVHFWFVMVHPFADGNGRIARVLTDMVLAQDEHLSNRYYSLSSQIMDERAKYYDILQQCQVAKRDITPWIEWFLTTFIKATDKSKILLSLVLEKADFWRKHHDVILSSRQRKVLNKLLDVGRGNFKGGLTTRKYAALTKTSKATAFREIDHLLKQGLIKKNRGEGRSVSYDLSW
ncbi:MAG: Fic family protein [Patescibacteria group bacterium]